MKDITSVQAKWLLSKILNMELLQLVHKPETVHPMANAEKGYVVPSHKYFSIAIILDILLEDLSNLSKMLDAAKYISFTTDT